MAVKKGHKLTVKIGKLELKNPVMLVSGTCGYGEEIEGLADIGRLGAIITKTITVKPREGNPPPRIVETPAGMLNSIGLENKGLKDFIFNKAGKLEKLGTAVIASIAGDSIEEFREMAEKLGKVKCVSAIELNLSCPNVAHSMKAHEFRLTAQDRNATAAVIKEVKRYAGLPVIAKLSPNVTDIKEIAIAAEAAGADAISAVNTLFGLSVDIATRRPRLTKGAGGLSGPAIRPVALHLIREIYSAVKIPVIGMGGIMSAGDALEFIICGARAIGIGTAGFVDPAAGINVLEGIISYMKSNGIDDIMSLVGTLRS